MRRSNRVVPFSPKVARPLAALLLVGVALSVAQCTMVGDSITGVDLARGKPAPVSCLHGCRKAYHESLEAERSRHQDQEAFCRSLAEPDRSACLQAEAALHDANLSGLRAQFEECANGCHRQGAGSAG